MKVATTHFGPCHQRLSESLSAHFVNETFGMNPLSLMAIYYYYRTHPVNNMSPIAEGSRCDRVSSDDRDRIYAISHMCTRVSDI